MHALIAFLFKKSDRLCAGWEVSKSLKELREQVENFKSHSAIRGKQHREADDALYEL